MSNRYAKGTRDTIDKIIERKIYAESKEICEIEVHFVDDLHVFINTLDGNVLRILHAGFDDDKAQMKLVNHLMKTVHNIELAQIRHKEELIEEQRRLKQEALDEWGQRVKYAYDNKTKLEAVYRSTGFLSGTADDNAGQPQEAGEDIGRSGNDDGTGE